MKTAIIENGLFEVNDIRKPTQRIRKARSRERAGCSISLRGNEITRSTDSVFLAKRLNRLSIQ